LQLCEEGSLGPAPVVLAVTGGGLTRARLGLSALLRGRKVDRVLVVGTSGSLSPGLRRGAFLLGEAVSGEVDPRGTLRPDPGAVAALAAALGARRAWLFTAARIATTPQAKARLRARLAGGEGTAPAPATTAVDLESLAYAEVAHAAGLPWLVLRTVLDEADEALPDYLNDCRDRGGAINRALVAWRALGRPSSLPALLRLRDRVRHCAEALALATLRLLPLWSTLRRV
jgi:adenosylhomocysteine nucleosidase